MSDKNGRTLTIKDIMTYWGHIVDGYFLNITNTNILNIQHYVLCNFKLDIEKYI